MLLSVLALLLALHKGYIRPFLPPILKRNLPSAETIDMWLLFSMGIVMGGHLKGEPFSQVAPIFLIAIGVCIAVSAVSAMGQRPPVKPIGQRSGRNRGSALSKR